MAEFVQTQSEESMDIFIMCDYLEIKYAFGFERMSLKFRNIVLHLEYVSFSLKSISHVILFLLFSLVSLPHLFLKLN